MIQVTALQKAKAGPFPREILNKKNKRILSSALKLYLIVIPGGFL